MSYRYTEQDIILLPSADLDLDDAEVSERHILKTFNDPDLWNEEASPNTVTRLFNSKTNPRTLHISFHKAHSLKFARNLHDTEAACIVIEAIRVMKHYHTTECSHPMSQYEEDEKQSGKKQFPWHLVVAFLLKRDI